MANPSSSPNISSVYDVFLSFRGQDTRRTFVDHLYAALVQKGITTFKDDVDKEIPKPLWRAIEESRSAIIVFSKDYASSSWCLDELVKIMECRKKNGQFVLPVYYYDFDPLSLRRQGPVFGELYAKHEMQKVKAWTSALVEAANLSGIGLIDGRYQATYIKEVVETVFRKLNINNRGTITVGKNHVTLGDTTATHGQVIGMDPRVQQVKELLQAKTVKTARSSALASSHPRSSWWKYDVFMSFRGNDSCKGFADQLHHALQQHNIHAFRSDQALARGRRIDSEHSKKVIEESCLAVIIFSETYAASSSCLDELVKIMNCTGKAGQMLFPVFYNVDSSDVRNQIGTFGEAFMQNKSEKVETWRRALVKACTSAGWYLNHTPKSDEPMLIESIVGVISRRLDRLSFSSSSSSLNGNLIGLEAPVKHVISLLKPESGGVHILGIHGMGGIGKTTLARAVFDRLSTCFDSSCFVENIREVSKYHDLEHIQGEMLSRLRLYGGEDKEKPVHRKVLVVLDDVWDISQLDTLLGFRKRCGMGSRILITTRDESLLVAHNIMQTYHVKPLSYNESYQFLRRHTFKKKDDGNTKAYEEELFPQVVSYAGGLPLALKVLSSLLYGRSKKEWTSTLARLQVFPEKAILDRLKISYEGLNADEKEMFLHIACFFKDTKRDYAVKILDSCGFAGDVGIRILEQKSLISISKGHIKMHDLVQQMGRDIVRREHPDEPGKRSRLWHAEDVHDILMDTKTTKEIDSIVVDDYGYDAVDMTKAFKSMPKLKLLKIRSHKQLRLPEGSNYFPTKLRWLTLENYPLPSLPKNFKGHELVGLELLGSSLSEAWHGTKNLWRLCFLDLSYSRKLIKTPNFTGTPNLKELKIEYCTSLIEVHESVGALGGLRLLSLRSCRKLATLPQSIFKLRSLTFLNLSGCSLQQLTISPGMIKSPESIKFLSNLVHIDLSSTSLVELDLRSLGKSSLPSLHSLKLPGSYHHHDTPVSSSKGKTGNGSGD